MVQLTSIETETPRSVLESSETEELQNELAHAFGRLLAWIFEGGETLEEVGFRAYILGYKIRPDLIHGKTLADIADLNQTGRSNAHNLAKDLSLTFGIRCRKQHKPNAVASYKRAPITETQLQLVNRFTQWEGLMKRAGIDPTKPFEAARIRRDLAPILRFAERLALLA